MSEISKKGLPGSLMFDTGVLIRALGHRQDDENSPACVALFNAMVDGNKRIYVASPSVTEMLRHSEPLDLPKTRSVVVVDFDRTAAELLGRNLKAAEVKAIRKQSGGTLNAIKYDALIVACAARRNAGLVSLDSNIRNVCSRLSVKYFTPFHFLADQQSLNL